jgi:hypothetical protein
VFIDQPFPTRGLDRRIELSISKLLPRSIPIRCIWARIGSSVMCDGCNFGISAA